MSKIKTRTIENQTRINEVLTREVIDVLTSNFDEKSISTTSYSKKLGVVMDIVKPKGMIF